MIALILAAGYGTRLYPLAEQTPKALLPVNGRPILGYLLDKLKDPSLQIRQILLVSNHRFADAFEFWLSRQEMPVSWKILDDGSTSEIDRLGSIGDFVFALRTARIDEDVLLLGSDNLFRGGLESFVVWARSKAPAVTLGAYDLPEKSLACKYGVLVTDESGRITQLQEKPTQPRSALVSMALYFFPRKALSQVLEYSGSADTLGSFIHWLIERQPVFAFRIQGPWLDIGDMSSYQKAQEFSQS